MAKKKERFFICPVCGELKTWKEILKDCEGGGVGLCTCEFTAFEWSEEHGLDVWCPRIYTEYEEIGKELYDRLKEERNHVTRLKILKVIPKKKRMEKI